MGSMTDAKIEAWQQETGIEPATGRCADLLEKISVGAFELIKVIELERSGIRGGDGYWYGSDPMDGMAYDLGRLIEEYLRHKRDEWEANLKKKGISPTPDFCDGPF